MGRVGKVSVGRTVRTCSDRRSQVIEHFCAPGRRFDWAYPSGPSTWFAVNRISRLRVDTEATARTENGSYWRPATPCPRGAGSPVLLVADLYDFESLCLPFR